LRQASSEIGNVTEMIRAIAFKTNLLALNAAIEAAQAGEMGAGFGVVAGEVKNLATAAADATSQIDSRVAAMKNHVQNVGASMTEVSSIIGRICGMQENISGAVQEQTSTTRSIALNIQETATGCRGGASRQGMHAMALQLSSLAEDLEKLCHNEAEETPSPGTWQEDKERIQSAAGLTGSQPNRRRRLT
jgi:methyl-accepting chemotaxis protein